MEDVTNDLEDVTNDLEEGIPDTSSTSPEDVTNDLEDNVIQDPTALTVSNQEQAAIPPGEITPPIDMMDVFDIPGSSAMGVKSLKPEPIPPKSKEQTWAEYSDSASKATVEGFRKTLHGLGILPRAITHAVGRFSEGASPMEIADSVGQVLTLSERADAPTMREAVFHAAMLSSPTPESARNTANVLGPTLQMGAEMAGDIASFEGLSAVSKLKAVGPFTSAVKTAVRPIKRFANNAGDKMYQALRNLPKEKFDDYLKVAADVQGSKDYTFDLAAKEIASTYQELHDRAIEGSRAARGLLVGSDSTISTKEMQEALDQAANGIISNAPDMARTKLGIRTGQSGRAAEDTYKMYRADISDNARREAAGQTPVEWINGRNSQQTIIGPSGIPLPPQPPPISDLRVSDIKEILQGLDREIQWQVKANLGQDPKTLLAWRYRKNLDNLLKARNPEYAKEMQPVSDIMNVIEEFDNRMLLRSKLTPEEQIHAKIGKKNPPLSERNAIKSLDNIAGTDYEVQLTNRRLYDEATKAIAKGEPVTPTSRAGKIAGILGGIGVTAASDITSGLNAYALSATVGAGLGQIVDKFGIPMARAVAKAMMTSPETAAKMTITGLSGTPLAANLSKKVLKFLAPGIGGALVRRVSGEDSTAYEDDSDIRITDYAAIDAVQKAIKSDPSIPNSMKMSVVRAMTKEYLDQGYVSISAQENTGKELKSDMIKKTIIDLKSKKVGK